MSKQLDALLKKYPDKLESWWDEGPIDGFKHSYWLDLKDGWISQDETTCIHEYTVKGALRAFKGSKFFEEEEGFMEALKKI